MRYEKGKKKKKERKKRKIIVAFLSCASITNLCFLVFLIFTRLGMIGDFVLDLEISKKIFELNPKVTTGEATMAMHHMRANRELAKAGHASFAFDHLILVPFFLLFPFPAALK
jgi:dsRNA-specific ribonuclease